MEQLRRKFAQDTNLYPDATALKAPARKQRPPSPPHSIITVSSSNSSVASPHRTQRIVVLSDSEDDDVVEVTSPLVPLRSQPPNHQIPNIRQGPTQDRGTKAVPIHIPTNKDLPTHATDPGYETFNMPQFDNIDDRKLSVTDTEKALRDLVTDVYNGGDQEFTIEDATVDGFREGIKLLPHQVTSRRWMADRESGKKLGGILADDMGLGKTIQTITRIVEGRAKKKDREAGWSGSTLVVCPVAVVSQWAAEIKKIAIGLKVIEHHGPSRTSDPEELAHAHVVITSYSIVTSEHGAYAPSAKDESKSSKSKVKKTQDSDSNGPDSDIAQVLKNAKRKKQKDALFHMQWWRIVLDEAHNIKNRNTKAALACCALEGKYRWCLTGTPMQNNVEELYSLIKFLGVRPLNDWHTFNTTIAKPVKGGRPLTAMKRLQVVLRSIMLRRTKDTLVNGKPILELPERIVNTVNCPFDDEERAFYNTVESKVQGSLEKLQQQGDFQRAYTSMLVLLLRLRQACNHPALVSEDYKKDKEAVEPKGAKENDEDDDADDLADRLAGLGLSSAKRCQLCQKELCGSGHESTAQGRRPRLGPSAAFCQDPKDIGNSGGDRRTLRRGEKTIIFSQFTSMLNLIEPFLRADGIKFVRYDGSMSKAERDVALANIKESHKTRVILISFKAGSTGLNLTCCNNVILVDPWWNPALEDQAFDRAHRFGQTRDVNIHKLCIPDSVEQRILDLQEKKRVLAAAALSGDKIKNMRLGVDDLVALFKSVVLPVEYIEFFDRPRYALTRVSDPAARSISSTDHVSCSQHLRNEVQLVIMPNEASQLLREAKGLQQSLKDSLKTREPWDKEVDFQRKSLRRQYLRLLLLHAYAAESKDAETHLWMQTSYAFISIYKQRIAALDRALHSSPRQQQQQPQQQQGRQQHGGHGVVEYRKLLQRFRQFLAEEEKFWIQLIIRIRQIFNLDEAHGALVALEIMPHDDGAAADVTSPKRNHFQFPSEAEVVAASLTPTTPEQHESRVAILSKALVCLGDIERYKEQYNESGGRPRAGHEDGPPAAMPSGKSGRGRRGGAPAAAPAPMVMSRMRTYDKAQRCYERARMLLPHDGNPSHQMAILASYQRDVFESLVHYYRALCVRHPYDTAAENLGTVLSKALDQWRTRGAKRDKEREREEARSGVASLAPRLRVEAFKERLIVLHALWRLSVEEMETTSPKLSQKVVDDFRSLVSERILPIDTISKVIVLVQGALYKHRVYRHSRGASLVPAAAMESHIVTHLLALHRALLEVGIAQLAEAPPEDAGEHDLAQRITATFRRTLPALRLASKWLRANLRYFSQSPHGLPEAVELPEANDVLKHGKGNSRRRDRERRPRTPPLSIMGVADFWRAYAQFSTALMHAFPIEILPKLSEPLEEDIDMVGFLPLEKFVSGDAAGTSSGRESFKEVSTGPVKAGQYTQAEEQVHPNETQLMRIADLLADAQALAKDEASPLKRADNDFLLEGVSFETVQVVEQVDRTMSNGRTHKTQIEEAPQQEVAVDASKSASLTSSAVVQQREAPDQHVADIEDDNMTEATRTDDDPVGDAFREALNASDGDDDEQEDEIVWDPRAITSPRDPAVVAALPASPTRLVMSSPVLSSFSPHGAESLSPRFRRANLDATPPIGSPPRGTTAQDLLNSVMQRSSDRFDMGHRHHSRESSAPQAHLLFGSGSLGGATPSIWSTPLDSTSLKFQGAAGTSSGPQYHPPFASQHQESISSPFPSQGSQGHSFNAHPSAVFVNGGHQRVQSQSLTRSLPLPAPNQSCLHDPFRSHLSALEQPMLAFISRAPAAYSDPIFSPSNAPNYFRQNPIGYQEHSVPYHHNPRAHSTSNPYPPLSSRAQLWDNAG
ncbi:hypothetical protein A0H81_13586 [Grifola frondosa]|uniref:Uncharacterized protein n=1 Tax=Grifola frondosa TaxID=5627 RepID=A0A1C7LP13_GRIFR|nr:hypothetical protein A0H81_13586 [Grifola frondosa]